MQPKTLKRLLWALGLGFLAGAIVMINLAIMYSSQRHYAQEGWAIFCAVNAIWVAAVGGLCLALAESRDLEFRQLDYDRQHQETT